MLETEHRCLAFTLFPLLPSELQHQIWIHALPGPRIVHVQRPWPWDQSVAKEVSSENDVQSIQFRSRSPAQDISDLSIACKDSRSAVLTQYNRIFLSTPTSTWFSFEKDFLYLDFGTRIGVMEYHTWDLESISWFDHVDGTIREDCASRVKNLVLHRADVVRKYIKLPNVEREEKILVRDILSIFNQVKVVVLADQLHRRDEGAEELVFLLGDIGDDPKYTEMPKSHDHRIPASEGLKSSILWRDFMEYGNTINMSFSALQESWEEFSKPGHDMPLFFNNGVVTGTTKRALLQICKTEENFKCLHVLDWDFVTGTKQYYGPLDYLGQIAFLELVLGRIFTSYEEDCQGVVVYGMCREDIVWLLGRVDTLRATADCEQEFVALLLSEAQEIGLEALMCKLDNPIH